ncbi:MAG: PQQ-binding-like beta-propeller repeat protein [Polyangiaceae bacterium]|nr:PQQ-binding-like beta-propeller repeat protein [Polyangiaceae bacterium]
MRVLGKRSWLATIAVAALSGACQSVSGGANPEVPNWVHRPSYSLQLLYKTNILASSRQVGEPYERGRPELDIAHRRVFVGSSDRGLYAIRVEDGSTIWRFETMGAVQCEPLYDPKEDVVYFGSNDGALYKAHAKDGKLIWRFYSRAEVARQPVLEGGTLYFANANDTFLAIDAKTGKKLWSQHHAPALGMEIAGHAGPTVWKGRVYAAYSDGTVTAYDAKTGTERWRGTDLSGEAEDSLGDIPPYLDADTTPVVGSVEGTAAVFAGHYEGGVFALDARGGQIIWSNPAVRGVTELLMWEQEAHGETTSDPGETARRILIASSGTSGMWGLDPETGEELWRRDLPEGGTSAMEPILGALLVTTTKQGIFLVSPLDGGVIDGIHTGAGFSGSVAAYGRRAFTVSNEGKLYSLHVSPPK